MSNKIQIDSLNGEVLTDIDVCDETSTIMLTTQSGRIIYIYHNQECCEMVEITGFDGDIYQLKGKILLECTQNETDLPEKNFMFPVKTDLQFVTDDLTVVSKWIGESNGYYSVSVDIAEITKENAKNFGIDYNGKCRAES